jgi:putative tryptophan/tyrosine transport system substrate-binding protein
VRRRRFIVGLGSATVAWASPAQAQQRPQPKIGFLSSASPTTYGVRLRAFREGLGETAFVEGQNVAVEYRWAEDHTDRLPALAAELVRREVAVIVAAGGSHSAMAAKAATATIPIVFGVAVDPVQAGLVASLNRPGGNLTGVTTLNIELGPKRLELLHGLVPTAKAMALLVNPTNYNVEGLAAGPQAAARTLGLQLHILHASTERDFDSAFDTLVRLRAGALVIGADVFFLSHSELLGALTARHAVPAIFQYRPFAAAGGLMSYGSDEAEYYRLIGNYTGRILKGEKPTDLPVQQATKVELIINLKTAKTLGITVPPTLLARADEVIE